MAEKMNENNWQEQVIEIPLCDYEDLLLARLELERLQKQKKQEDIYKRNTEISEALGNIYNA